MVYDVDVNWVVKCWFWLLVLLLIVMVWVLLYSKIEL